MGKYRQAIDINGHNSVAFILNRIRPNSTILEFGCSNGYMTQYMKDTLNCKVNIVEIDQADGIEASQYAEEYLIGSTDGNIEKYYWVDEWDYKFDHIIFADVLEHLVDPWNVLKQAANLVKDDGTILISVPNVSHNSVIIDLINGKFNYRELGLLDNTHIRFFTRESLSKMVVDAGLCVSGEFNTYCAVEHTEFHHTWDHVRPEVATALQARGDDGNLYQFVWELKK